MKSRGDLDAAHQIQSRGARQRLRAIVTGKGIVIRDPQRFETHRHRLVDKLRRRSGPVRFVGVGVQVDQKEISPKLPSLA